MSDQSKHLSLYRRIPWHHPLTILIGIPVCLLIAFGGANLGYILTRTSLLTDSTFILIILFASRVWGFLRSLILIFLIFVLYPYAMFTPLQHLEQWHSIPILVPTLIAGIIISWVNSQLQIRTRESQELASRLSIANYELNRTNNEKDQMLAFVSHELKTPLTTISGRIQLLAKRLKPETSVPTEKVLPTLYTIQKQNTRLSYLIDDLTDKYRANSGHLTLHFQPCNLTQITQQVITEYQLTTNRTIHFTTTDKDVLINADPIRLTQVISNLISNALKYSPSNTQVNVQIETQNTTVSLTVTDQGSGISSENLPYIFERFYRTPDAQNSGQQGLGIGLAITKDIVEQHSGTITCTSKVGQGSTFTLTFPELQTAQKLLLQSEHS